MSTAKDITRSIRTDPIELEIFSKIFASLVEQMGVTIARTAHTTFVREVQDFGNALATLDGSFFAYPRTLGASTLLGLPFADCIDFFDDYHEGDVMFTNDPFVSQAGCTHVPDLTVWTPVIVDNQLLCFTWGFIHSSDIGGSVPGSIAPSLIDTFQEGIRIPPVKLYRRGEVNADVRDILKNNVRIPEQMWGDVQALRAGMQLAERKLQDLARRYGVEKLRQVMDDLLLYSELKARRIFERIPAGTYHFSDYVEDDTISEVPIRISLNMTVADGRIHLDYTGTDPQVASAYNVPTAGKVHPWVMAGLGYYVVSQDPDIPTNAGFFRAITVKLPKGSIVNPIFPAAIGLRSLAGVRMIEIILGALAQAVPEHAPAAGSGVSTVVMLSVPDFERGGRRINVVNPCVGGSGGRPIGDGFDGVDFLFGFMRNTPAEILESETAILVKRFGFRCDSGGPGKYRGGLAVSLEFQVTAPDATVIARGMDRTLFDPWGVHGGLPGSRMPLAIVNPGTNRERAIRKIDVLRLDAGDVVRIQSPGGGGYGDPLERDPEKVRLDLEFGFISSAAADAAYGVKFGATGAVDHERTDANRSRLKAASERSPESIFTFGTHRQAMDRLWPPEARWALAQILDQVPILMRYRIKNKIYETLVPAGRNTPIAAIEIDECWNTVRQHLYPAQLVARRERDSRSPQGMPK
jgi:N-methylhydantoinase B